MNEANWEQEFDEQFLHGMKIVISEPYQEMALESTVANEIKQFISKTLSLHDKKLAEKADAINKCLERIKAIETKKMDVALHDNRVYNPSISSWAITAQAHLATLVAQVIEGEKV